MKGVIFAAGLGTRLYPLTKDKPKALVEVNGITMLEHTLLKMKIAGITEVVVNVHAFADKVEDWLKAFSEKNTSFSIKISDERHILLETGGGLKKMQPLLVDTPFLVHNVDVLSDIDLLKLKEADDRFYSKDLLDASDCGSSEILHLATLCVRKTESDRYFLFNEAGFLCGWENVKTGEKKISRPNETNLQRFSFTGIHIIHPKIFKLIKEEGVFSITEVYLRLATEYEIRMFDASNSKWFDVGSPEQLFLAEKF